MDGFAAALQESLTDPKQLEASPLQAEPGQKESSAEKASEDTASLIVKLLLRAAYNPGPNFAHLLLGFDVTDGVQGQHPPDSTSPNCTGLASVLILLASSLR